MLSEHCIIHSYLILTNSDTPFPVWQIPRELQTTVWVIVAHGVAEKWRGPWSLTHLHTTCLNWESALGTKVRRSGWWRGYCASAILVESCFALEVRANYIPPRVGHTSPNVLCECSEFNCICRLRIVPAYLCKEHSEGEKGKWKPR